jgi:2-phospho-L-lactate guanylyltransferase
MQGTVSTFDPVERTGSLLLDDGTPVDFGRNAFELSGLRLLRLGQRVRIEYGEDGTVDKIAIPTF